MRVLIAHTDEASRIKLANSVSRIDGWPLDLVPVGEGSEALDVLLHDDPPEVALIDWDLAGVEGPEMCRLVRDFHHGRDTWIVVLAGPAHEDTADAWRAGARDCVATPASAQAIAEAVAKGLREMAPASGPEALPPGAPPAPEREGRARPTLDPLCALDAVRSLDDEVCGDGFAGLTADLCATISADKDAEGPAELAAGPARLCAQRVDLDDDGTAAHGRAALDALLATL